MVPDCGLAAHLEMFNVANLLDGAVALLNMPMPVVLFGEGFPVKRQAGRRRARKPHNGVAGFSAKSETV